MARFQRLEVLNTVVSTGLVPIFYNPDVEVARQVAKACAAGGTRVLEFTNRGDFAVAVFRDLAEYVARELPQVILGVGTVVDEPTAALYIAHGANFVVAPNLNPAVARLCNRRKVAYIPGCGSVSEISDAEEMGVEIVKLFPGDSVGGPEFVKAILAPCPWTRIMPTGGVEATKESIAAWFKAGVAAVGMGSKLIQKDLVARGDFAAVGDKVEKVLGWIREARGEAIFLGIEHIGLYPYANATAGDVAGWYAGMFDLKSDEGSASFFLKGGGAGRIEVMKQGDTDRCHLAVRVSNFEKAMEILSSRGIEFEESKIGPETKLVYLKNTDPAGNRIHLLWIR